MSLRMMILRPLGGIRNSTLRRALLVGYGAPACIALQIGQVLLAPLAITVVFLSGVVRGSIEAFSDTVDCLLASTKAEPASWRAMFNTLRRIWKWDRDTWAARQPQVVIRNPKGALTTPGMREEEG